MNLRELSEAIDRLSPGACEGILVAFQVMHPESELLDFEEYVSTIIPNHVGIMRKSLQVLQGNEDAFFERLRSKAREKCLMKGIFVH